MKDFIVTTLAAGGFGDAIHALDAYQRIASLRRRQGLSTKNLHLIVHVTDSHAYDAGQPTFAESVSKLKEVAAEYGIPASQYQFILYVPALENDSLEKTKEIDRKHRLLFKAIFKDARVILNVSYPLICEPWGQRFNMHHLPDWFKAVAPQAVFTLCAEHGASAHGLEQIRASNIHYANMGFRQTEHGILFHAPTPGSRIDKIAKLPPQVREKIRSPEHTAFVPAYFLSPQSLKLFIINLVRGQFFNDPNITDYIVITNIRLEGADKGIPIYTATGLNKNLFLVTAQVNQLMYELAYKVAGCRGDKTFEYCCSYGILPFYLPPDFKKNDVLLPFIQYLKSKHAPAILIDFFSAFECYPDQARPDNISALKLPSNITSHTLAEQSEFTPYPADFNTVYQAWRKFLAANRNEMKYPIEAIYARALIKYQNPRQFSCFDHQSAVRSGVLYGTSLLSMALINGLVWKFRPEEVMTASIVSVVIPLAIAIHFLLNACRHQGLAKTLRPYQAQLGNPRFQLEPAASPTDAVIINISNNRGVQLKAADSQPFRLTVNTNPTGSSKICGNPLLVTKSTGNSAHYTIPIP